MLDGQLALGVVQHLARILVRHARDLHQAADGAAHAAGRDAVFFIVLLLNLAPAVRLGDGAVHGVGERICVHDDPALHVAGGAADGLDQRLLGAQEALLVRVQNRHQRDLRKVQALAQQVDAHQHVEFAGAQTLDQLDAVEGVHVGVQVLHLHVHLPQVLGQTLGHALGEGGHQHAPALCGDRANLAQQIVHLIPRRAHDDLRVDQAGGADDLLHHLLRALQLVGAGGGGDVDDLVHLLLELVELQRAVVVGGGQAEAVVHQRLLAGEVAVVHGADLGDGHVALVHQDQQVLGEVVQQRERRLAALTAVEVAGVVLDAVAVADLPQHFDVVARALLQALGLQQPVVGLEVCKAVAQVVFDLGDAALQLVLGDGVVAGGEEDDVGHVPQHPSGDDLDFGDALDLVAEKLHAHRLLLAGGGDDLYNIAPDVEGAALGLEVVAGILNLHQAVQQLLDLHLHALAQGHGQILVLRGVAQAVDAADRGHDDHVPALRQPAGGAVAHAVDLVVDGAVLLDEGVRGGNVGFGLVVVVVGHEVAHGVVREELLELARQLGRQRLVVGDHQRGPVGLGDDVGHGEGLA